MSYISPPPEWMPGNEALDHIREADGCSASNAIKQLRTSIADGAVSARLPDPKNPRRNAIFPPWADTLIANHGGPGASPRLSPGVRQFPNKENWGTALLQKNGTVQFFGSDTPWYRFEVLQAHVLKIWQAPELEFRVSSRTKIGRAGRKPRLRRQVIDWLKRNYPNGVPENVPLVALCAELKSAAGLLVSERTLGRALTEFRGPAKSVTI